MGTEYTGKIYDDAVFHVQTINRHRLMSDGKGVTSLVGLAGCPLSCKYCINMDVLPKVKAKEYTAGELWDRLSIDYCYFLATEGGVTFGGGESLLHANAISQFLQKKPDGVAVNIETSLNVQMDARLFGMIARNCDSFIIDIKSLDDETYKKYTGKVNANVLKHLSLIAELGLCSKCRIRIPVIPGFKDKETAMREAEKIREMGYDNIDVFQYSIRDYMKKGDVS